MKTVKTKALITALTLSFAACGTSPDSQDPDPNTPGELIQSELTRELSPNVDQGTLQKLTSDNRAFAFDLMEQIRSEDGGNIFLSPHSISIALAMVYPGAAGETKTQLADILNFSLPEDKLHPAFNSLDLELAKRSQITTLEEEDTPPTLNIVNAVWGQQDYPFASDYLDTLALNYGAGLRAVDFETDPDGNRKLINKWVEDNTNNRIKDLLPKDSISSQTRLVLTNAIYFLASWDSPFHEASTSDRPFQLLDGSEIDTPLMSQAGYFPHLIDAQTSAISIPYVGGDLSFIALQPTDSDGFEEWEENLTADYFDSIIKDMAPGQGFITLPRFEVEGDYDLMALFDLMGWENFGDLRRMLENDVAALEISAIVHKSFINLDEKGTEAAAATAVVTDESAGDPSENFELRFDRPFYYAIYDHPTDTILFIGRLMEP